jgi:hypothetical protein
MNMIIPKHVGVGIYIQKREEAEPKIQTPEMGDARSQNEPPGHHAGWMMCGQQNSFSLNSCSIHNHCD